MAGEIACADLGDKVPALAGMSFVQWGEDVPRSEEHTSELQSLMRISYAVFCLKHNKTINHANQVQSRHTRIQKHTKVHIHNYKCSPNDTIRLTKPYPSYKHQT